MTDRPAPLPGQAATGEFAQSIVTSRLGFAGLTATLR
jgi:hypothetical protein